ncbi:MAG: glycosyltransferase family 4 protein [Sedimentibacter sp.]|nr:glycosyltransferase family 4 protein [Sedimentibacter sp.]
MKIAYITAQAPWGRGETFIIDEMLALKKAGTELLIIPRNPPKEVFHSDAVPLLTAAHQVPLISFNVVWHFIASLMMKPNLWWILSSIIRHSRSFSLLLKNFAVVPKGVFCARLLKKAGINHIHAHWGSTTATIGYVISQLSGIPWSFTLHRWDIYENNMLEEKARSASFVRCISQKGKVDLLKIIGSNYADKVRVVHMGVKVPTMDKTPIASRFNNWNASDKKFVFILPANLLPVKGHEYLIDAVSLLSQNGLKNFHFIFYGDGPLRKRLEEYIHNKGVKEYIEMPSIIPHNELINIYKNGNADAVVLPSINTEDGEHEGIPVALIEAMGYGVPVISTDTGSIAELLSDGAGLLVKEKSPNELAEAILNLVSNKNFALNLGLKGYEKVSKEFNIEKTSRALLQLISQEKA